MKSAWPGVSTMFNRTSRPDPRSCSSRTVVLATVIDTEWPSRFSISSKSLTQVPSPTLPSRFTDPVR